MKKTPLLSLLFVGCATAGNIEKEIIVIEPTTFEERKPALIPPEERLETIVDEAEPIKLEIGKKYPVVKGLIETPSGICKKVAKVILVPEWFEVHCGNYSFGHIEKEKGFFYEIYEGNLGKLGSFGRFNYFPGKKDDRGIVAWSWTPESYNELLKDNNGLSISEKEEKFLTKQMNVEKAETLWRKWKEKIFH